MHVWPPRRRQNVIQSTSLFMGYHFVYCGVIRERQCLWMISITATTPLTRGCSNTRHTLYVRQPHVKSERYSTHVSLYGLPICLLRCDSWTTVSLDDLHHGDNAAHTRLQQHSTYTWCSTATREARHTYTGSSVANLLATLCSRYVCVLSINRWQDFLWAFGIWKIGRPTVGRWVVIGRQTVGD